MMFLIQPAFPQDDVPLTSALTELKQKAEQDDTSAQYNLGLMYDYGYGVPEDDREAVRLVSCGSRSGIRTCPS